MSDEQGGGPMRISDILAGFKRRTIIPASFFPRGEYVYLRDLVPWEIENAKIEVDDDIEYVYGGNAVELLIELSNGEIEGIGVALIGASTLFTRPEPRFYEGEFERGIKLLAKPIWRNDED